jgi:hypothetical protein
MQMIYETSSPELPMVWMFKKAAVEPRGMQASPQAMTQLISTALIGILRVGETWRLLVSPTSSMGEAYV